MMLYLGLLLMLMGPMPALTATPEGLGVRQHPRRLSVMRGETANLSCHFKVESFSYGVQWFKMKAEKQLIGESPRRIEEKKNQSASLVITEVAPEDSGWYYCEVNTLQREPEEGNGTELLVLAPPSAPQIFLQVPPDPHTGAWALLCSTTGFHPDKLTLTWTQRSAAPDIERPSLINCSLPRVFGGPPEEAPPSPSSECFHMMDERSGESYLFSTIPLPQRWSLHTGVTYTCRVQDHPAMTAAAAASFTWDAAPNELILYLNILKMCLLSAATVVLLLEAAKHCCTRGK